MKGVRMDVWYGMDNDKQRDSSDWQGHVSFVFKPRKRKSSSCSQQTFLGNYPYSGTKEFEFESTHFGHRLLIEDCDAGSTF